VPPRKSAAAAANDRGMQVLELKLSILISGPGQRRNPALDVLTGRVPDQRLVTLQAGLTATRAQVEGETVVARPPSTMVLPAAAIKMAAVARSTRPAASPWLSSGEIEGQPRLRLMSPPPSRWLRLPIVGGILVWLRAECRPYTWRARSPRAHPAS
jgi:hypothetical protein